jgi:hypothetical protein
MMEVRAARVRRRRRRVETIGADSRSMDRVYRGWHPIAVLLAVLCFCEATSSAADAQGTASLYSRTYGVADGLFASTIHAIVQYGTGYLWLGADSGLPCCRGQLIPSS